MPNLVTLSLNHSGQFSGEVCKDQDEGLAVDFVIIMFKTLRYLIWNYIFMLFSVLGSSTFFLNSTTVQSIKLVSDKHFLLFSHLQAMLCSTLRL